MILYGGGGFSNVSDDVMKRKKIWNHKVVKNNGNGGFDKLKFVRFVTG